jgi:Holliday junction resolvasome RuvABC endonuclease subunit
MLRIVGVDPSLRNWGLAKGTYDVERKQLTIAEIHVIQPTLPKGNKIRKSAIDLIAAEALAHGMLEFVGEAHMTFVEVPHGSQSAAAMKGYGICIGVLGALREAGMPFFELNQREVKLAAVGQKDATKHEMIDWAMAQHPEANWPMKTSKGIQTVISGKAEHMADAIATIHAGIQSAYFNQFKR